MSKVIAIFAQICIVTSMGDVKNTHITLGPLPYLYEKKLQNVAYFKSISVHHLFYSLSKYFYLFR